VTETLLESEFFGHEKGAFTGAVVQKKGKLEFAHGGTVFLDEIGELAPGLQAKLLRVLQEHEFERVGGTQKIKIDIRVIAATNRDLEAAMRSGSFRPDLFYRLNVVALDAPPLRERREDVPLLAAFFAQRFAREAGRHVTGLSDRARACLLAYDWPGNVRELENAIERAVVLGTTDMILAEDLPDSVVEAEPPQSETGSYHDTIRETKKRLIIDALERAGGSFTDAARLLDVHPNYLHRLATQLSVRRRGA
jgi:transcriptional regulator with PAS, ATPase and Fis domain